MTAIVKWPVKKKDHHIHTIKALPNAVKYQLSSFNNYDHVSEIIDYDMLALIMLPVREMS